MNKSEILIIQNIKTVKSKATGLEKILALTEKGFVCGRCVCVCVCHIYVILYVIGKPIILKIYINLTNP